MPLVRIPSERNQFFVLLSAQSPKIGCTKEERHEDANMSPATSV